MEYAKQQKAQTAYRIGLLFNFAATTALCLILIVYYLIKDLPLTALTVFPIALLMIAFSFIAWQNSGAIWILGQLIPSGIVWFYLPMKWLILVDLIIGIAILIFGVVLFGKTPKELKTAHIKDRLSGWKQIVTVGVPALVISLSVIISAFNVSTDSFYVGNTIGKNIKQIANKRERL